MKIFLDLFLLASQKKIPERTVRLVEQNMRFRYFKKFRADSCYAGVSGAVKGKVVPVIFRLAFMENILQKEAEPWEFGYSLRKSLSD